MNNFMGLFILSYRNIYHLTNIIFKLYINKTYISILLPLPYNPSHAPYSLSNS